MSILRQLGTNSAVYAGTSLLQRGTAFLLMPLYTHYLDPSAYGVLAIVTAINGLLSVAFTLGLTGAMTRFYFEYQHDPRTLAEFWGTVLVTVLLLSGGLAGLTLLAGERVLHPVLGGVPFWPYVAMGVMATFFQPFFTTVLAVLQMRNQALRYAVLSLSNFALTTVLTIAFLVGLGWGIIGPLAAALIVSVLFFVVSLWVLRTDIRPCLRWHHLRPALGYSLPLVPHTVSGQATTFADRLVINHFLGTAAAGLYSVGATVSLAMEVAAQSVNRAYVPLTMAALKRGTRDDLEQIRTVGTLVVGAFCLLGTAIAAFSHELMHLIASPAFASASEVIPPLVFGGVANAFYLLFVNVLFYERSAVKLIPVGTFGAAVASVVLALVLTPPFGMLGAAWATLLAQAAAALLIAALACRIESVHWRYARYASAFVASLLAGLLLSRVDAGGAATTLATKVLGLAAASAVLGTLLWNRPAILAQAALSLLRRRPDAAAALFTLHEASA